MSTRKLVVALALTAVFGAGAMAAETPKLGQPITDSQGNLTFDNLGNVRVYTAADLKVSRRELLNVGTGTIKLQTAPSPSSSLKVFVGGTQLTSGFSISGKTLTLTGSYAFDPTHCGIGFVARHAMVT